MKLPNASVYGEPITPHGAQRQILASSALREPNQRRLFCFRTAGGAFLPVVHQQPTSLNLPLASGTATRRTSISACGWRGPPDSLCPIPASTVLATRSRL